LNLTTEYLLDIEDSVDNTDTMTEREIRLIKMFRKMNSGKQNCLFMTAEYFYENEEVNELHIKKCSNSEKGTTKTSRDESNSDENLLS
jgi:hypothetical protein